MCCVSLCVCYQIKSIIKKPHVSDLVEFENFEKMMNNIGGFRKLGGVRNPLSTMERGLVFCEISKGGGTSRILILSGQPCSKGLCVFKNTAGSFPEFSKKKILPRNIFKSHLVIVKSQ